MRNRPCFTGLINFTNEIRKTAFKVGLGILCCVPVSSRSEVLFSWAQMVAGSNLSIRIVVSPDDVCPLLYVDGVGAEMNIRALPDEGVFDDIVCESVLPPSLKVRTIRAAGREFPDLHIKVGREKLRVAVLGDTGCRVSNMVKQDCKSPEGWVLNKVLHGIASHNPDIVMHVGDYLYREVTCGDESKCDTEVFGDNSKAWAADWLRLMDAIADKQVFAFARGNHEDCKRSYRGWFRYLDANPLQAREPACEEVVPTWLLDFAKWDMGNIGVYIYDSSSILDSSAACKECVEKFKSRFLEVNDIGRNDIRTKILLTHRPLWSHLDADISLEHSGSALEVDLMGDVLLRDFRGIISGHVHLGELLYVHKADGMEITKTLSSISHGKGPKLFQIISGNGGALLEREVLPKEIDMFSSQEGFSISVMETLRRYGFCIIDFLEDDEFRASATFYDADGRKHKRFVIE